MRKVADDFAGRCLADRVEALRQVTHLGQPVLNEDGTITAGIGPDSGCACACSMFGGAGGKQPEEPVSPTYCLCGAGHSRHLYQIALDRELRTKAVLSASLASQGRKCAGSCSKSWNRAGKIRQARWYNQQDSGHSL